MTENFQDLGINYSILEEIKKRGFKSPTAIQKKAIPVVLRGENVIAAAPTGSGKTLCYAVSAIQNSKVGSGLQAIVIAPTRELVKQISNEITLFSKLRNLKVHAIFGGQNASLEQYNVILESEILIATPGMLLEHIEKNHLDISGIKTLILDEADNLITTEFEENIVKIVELIPRTRQTLMFSATITPEVAKIANKYMRNPVKVYAGTKVDNKQLKQFFYQTDPDKKLSLLLHVLNTERIGLSIIFVNRTQTAEFVSKNLQKSGYETTLLHGEMTTGKRNKIIEDFRDNKFDILVATDIAARGLDFEGITHIINYNIPQDETKYIHRIGRTARAGNRGTIINFVTTKDGHNMINIIEKCNLHIVKKETPQNLESIKPVAVNKVKGKQNNKPNQNNIIQNKE